MSTQLAEKLVAGRAAANRPNRRYRLAPKPGSCGGSAARCCTTSVRQSLVPARLRVTLVILLSLLFWYGLFMLFSGGFEFLA